MKKLLYLSFIVLLLMGCEKCCPPKKPKPQKPISTYIPNQIILDAQGLGSNYPDVEKYLKNQGFKKIDSCDCSKGIELWESTQDVDIIGKISDASGGGANAISGNAWRLSPNFVLSPTLVISKESQYPRDTSKHFQPAAGTPITVAIIDTGVDSTNNSISNYLWHRTTPASCPTEGVLGLNSSDRTISEPVDLQGHGTHLNGIISGLPDNAGDAGNTKIEMLNVKFTRGNTGSGDLFKATCGLYYALDKGAQVLNLSWGYAGYETPELIKSFLNTAKNMNKNIIVVAGAGNSHTNIDSIPFWPASFSKDFDFVISVGAYNSHLTPSVLYDSTNYGKTVNVFAPGVDIYSTILTSQGTLAFGTGTSMSTAYVSRVAAILKTKYPLLPASSIKKCLINSGKLKTIDSKQVMLFDAPSAISATCN